MVLFWLTTVLMVVVALAFLLIPLLRTRTSESNDIEGTEINVAVYRERLTELEVDKAEGKVSDEEFSRIQLELQRALLEDASMATERKQETRSQRWLLPAIVTLVLPVCSYGLYLQLGASDLLDQVPESAAANPHGDGSMGEMAVQLIKELEENPDDSQGWFALGRTYIAIGQYQKALEAFDRVTAILGKEYAEILAQKAQAVYFESGNTVTPELEAIIDRAQQDDSNDPGLNGLLGMIAFDQGDYQDAADYWELMLVHVRPGMSEEGIRQAIDMARQKLVEGGQQVTDRPQAQPAAQMLFGNKPAQVLVELDASLAEEVEDSQTVFVALKHAGGPPMPIAAVRLRVADLPTLVLIDDSNVLARGASLEGSTQIVLMATVSKSGTAGASAGDLRGESTPMSLTEAGAKVISVNINTVVN